MKTLIVAKTRQGSAACIGGITFEGRSVRLVPPRPDDHWGLDFQVGEVWEIDGDPPSSVISPHVENIVVRSRRRMGPMTDPLPFIDRHMPAAAGGPEMLYCGLARRRSNGSLFISEETGIPPFSTMFWRPDRPLIRDLTGKRIRYRYNGEASLVFVGFQDPIEEIPAGALVRVSLAHWWRPPEHPEEPPRCYVQLSGWFENTFDGGRMTDDGRRTTDRTMGDTGDTETAVGGRRAAVGSYSQSPTPTAERTESVTRHPSSLVRPDLESARETMARVFGFREFRPIQEEILESVLARRDTLGIMPTGAGKSLCYQLPAMLFEGLTLVVSPLISLMQDQVDQLRAVGIPAAALNSSLPYEEYVAHTRRIRSGDTRIVYLAPETLIRPETQVLLESARVELFAIDEAHCISEWGHDFRPEYRRLREIRERFGNATCLALTATATDRVRQDIQRQLGIGAGNTFVAPFDRANLFLEARRRKSAVDQVLEFLSTRHDQRGIIYCATREQVDKLVEQLSDEGVSALPYHAGMSDSDRKTNQRRFQHDQVDVMVATIAFGMGINKPDVRFVAHTALPASLETYYQQIGRAGRDGLRADCLLLHSRADLSTAYRFIDEGSEEQRAGRAARLHAMARYAEATACRRQILLPYFGDAAPEEPCGFCDNCLATDSGRQEVDVSEDARQFLKCVLQTRQKFGATYIIELLRGSKSARVLRWRHERLPIYGLGRNRSAESWRMLADRFIERGLVEVEMEHGTLRLAAAGRRVLEGGSVAVLMEEPAARFVAKETRLEYDPGLFEDLRQLRREIAQQEGVPPYVVFSDRSLIEMAASFPQTREEFLGLHGVGERKEESYGERFRSAIRDYAERHGTERERLSIAPDSSVGERGRRHIQVAEAFRAGASINELRARWGVAAGTIIQHLHRYASERGHLDPERLRAELSLKEAEQRNIHALFDDLGEERLGPIFESLHGEIPYTELHLFRLYRQCLRRVTDDGRRMTDSGEDR